MSTDREHDTVDVPSIPLPELAAIRPDVGERFPDIALADQFGRQVDLHADRAGRRALVVFIRSADW